MKSSLSTLFGTAVAALGISNDGKFDRQIKSPYVLNMRSVHKFTKSFSAFVYDSVVVVVVVGLKHILRLV